MKGILKNVVWGGVFLFISLHPNGVNAKNNLGISETNISQQNKNVSGTVTDQSGEPVIGASVVEKGTRNGTVTDIDGNYSLSTASNAVLVFSYIGYASQEVSVAGKTKIDVVLKEDVAQLSEVVVTGYGGR